MWSQAQFNLFKGPLYRRVIALIESYIEQGILVSGERLPSERELALRLNINRSTVVHAFAILTERHILVRKLGNGTFVNDNKWGLQHSPTINWHLPSHFHPPISLYRQKVQQLKKQALLKGETICDLANGDLPAYLLPKLTIPEMSSQELIYQEKNSDQLQTGLPSLKGRIVDYMWQKFTMSVADDEILITSGTQQALFLITQGLLKPGDTIAVESPSYFYSLPLFQAAGIRLYGIKMDKQGILIDGLDQLHQQQPIKWLLLNPIFQNPTGITMSLTRKKQILSFCRKVGIGIIEDDAYSSLSFDQQIDCSPIKKLDQHNQVIYLGSLSKYLGRSIRVGWMIAPASVIRRLSEIRQYIDSGLSILPQLLAEDYLQNHYSSHQQYLRQQLQRKRDDLLCWLNQHHPNYHYYHHVQGGMHLYLNLMVHNIKQEEQLLNYWLTNRITVTKGEIFGDTFGFVRLSYGHFIENIV